MTPSYIVPPPPKALADKDLDHILWRAEYALRALDGQHVLITGATGFIGSWLTDCLLHARDMLPLDLFVTVVGRDFSKLAHWRDQGPNVLVWGGDDIRHLRFPLIAPPVTHVIHCASAGSAADNDAKPRDVFHMIAGGSDHVAAVAQANGVKRFLHLSSGSVYKPADTIYRETDLLRANLGTSRADRFAYAKVLAEQNVLAHVPQAVIARIFALIGPRLGPQFAAAQFVADTLAGRRIQITGTGLDVRSYLYAADLAAWLFTLLTMGEAGGIYNVGAPVPITIAELGGTVAALGDTPTAPTLLGQGVAGRPFVPNVSKAARLNLEAWTPFQTAVERTMEWHRGS